jgi:uncharacterized membrane protein YkvA (DUF1232 family)
MGGEKFKVSFSLDEEDAEYFRSLYRKVRKNAATQDPQQIIKDARNVVQRARASKKTPNFVIEAISVLADLVDLIQDDAYAAPQRVRSEVLAALAYFSNPEDLIPDQVPGLGFLDDAIMVKFIEEEFKNELWGYRRFRKLRDSSEQRPWSAPASDRLRQRLETDRRRVRAEIDERNAKDEARRKSGRFFGW